MDDGQNRQIRVGSSSPFTYTLNWSLTYDQTKFFEAWIEYDVARGAGYTDIPIGNRTVNVRPVTGVPVYTPNGAKWVVSLDVEELQAGPVIPARNGVLPVWPGTLPEFEKDSYTLSDPGAVTRSDIDNGRAEMRVRFRGRVTEYSGKLILTQSQRDIFWQFWKNTLINGQTWFMAPFANAVSQSKLRARIVAAPVESPNGAWYELTFALETVNAPIMSIYEYHAIGTFVNTYVVSGYVDDGYAGFWIL
jgi:hypothetical protein